MGFCFVCFVAVFLYSPVTKCNMCVFSIVLETGDSKIKI